MEDHLDSDDEDRVPKSTILPTETFSHDSESANICFLENILTVHQQQSLQRTPVCSKHERVFVFFVLLPCRIHIRS